jgi:hypothetical protein
LSSRRWATTGAAPAKFDERSGNVYENKELGKKAVGWQTLLLNV